MLSINSILILGAGELGLALLASLMHDTDQLPDSSKPSITVLLRPSSKPLPRKLSLGTNSSSTVDTSHISVIKHDISSLSSSSLASLLKPYDTVISCTGFSAGKGTQLRITQAALEAGVRRFFPWQFGVDYERVGKGSGQDLFDEQLAVRELLRNQGEGKTQMDWVIVSTGIFTSFIFEDSFGVVEGALSNPSGPITVRALGSWTNALSVTSVEDIAMLTTKILFDDKVHSQVIHVAGDTITYERLVNVVRRLFESSSSSPISLSPSSLDEAIPVTSTREIKKELWTLPYLASQLSQNPADTILKYRVSFSKGVGVSWPLEETYNKREGVETIDVEGWLRGRIGVFRKRSEDGKGGEGEVGGLRYDHYPT
ncbi:hypothetical protein CPB83DRAFT_195021 [Crepidotus variabilis]|uniref:NmrA-like domain-containing protein n=1 Tax=Crepidotus variabilis TaxID=179855 RepID=A0A9P6JHY1_9AGAR|nr:hypothetical protein CPB83DRAFT_195021 [Crepidotus variabilis]